MSRLFVCEKRAQALSYQKHCLEGDAIILCPAVVSCVFDYPSELAFSELPYTDLSPCYKNNPKGLLWLEYAYGAYFDLNSQREGLEAA
jgi:hypothetical protein